MTQFRISRFKMDEIRPHCTILIVGKRGTGKSTLLKDILYHLRSKVDIAFSMSPTHETVDMFESCMPRSHVFNGYNYQQIQTLIENLKILDEEKKERHVLLALDDCMYDKKIMKSVEMREIHMNGRHWNLYFINCVQYLMDIPPELRGQIDYVFAFKDNIRKNREKLYNYFFGIFDSFKDFDKVMRTCTENYECLVLDSKQSSNDISKCVFYYKANIDIGEFRMGRSVFFKLDKFFRPKKKKVSNWLQKQQQNKKKAEEQNQEADENVKTI